MRDGIYTTEHKEAEARRQKLSGFEATQGSVVVMRFDELCVL